MEFHWLALFFSLSVILMAAQAALPPEVYWERMLPNTPIPKVIRELSKLGNVEKLKKAITPLLNTLYELQDGVKKITSQDGFLHFRYGDKKNDLQDGVEEISEEFPFNSYGVKKNELQDGVEKISEGFLFFTYGVKKNELQDGVKKITSQDGFLPFYGVKKNELQDGFLPFYNVKKNELQDGFLPFYGVKKNELQDDFLPFYNVKKNELQDGFLPFYGVKKNELQDGVPEISSLDGTKKTKLEDDVKKISSQDDSKEISSQDETPYDPQSKENAVLRGIGPVANHHHHDHSKPSLFFSEEGLRRGAKLDVELPKRKFVTPLLPREITEHLPFSSEKINEILKILAVKPDSKNAENVEETLKICEEPAMNGEEKHCATSVESMVDFVTSKLGNNARVTSTEIESKSQKFIVKDGVKILAEEEIIACHPMNYPYVVFYCHKISNSTAHFMPLEGEDGSRVKAVAVCHKDTSEWDPNYIAFQVLKVKPGTSPVCHLFPDGHLIWYAK